MAYNAAANTIAVGDVVIYTIDTGDIAGNLAVGQLRPAVVVVVNPGQFNGSTNDAHGNPQPGPNGYNVHVFLDSSDGGPLSLLKNGVPLYTTSEAGQLSIPGT